MVAAITLVLMLSYYTKPLFLVIIVSLTKQNYTNLSVTTDSEQNITSNDENRTVVVFVGDSCKSKAGDTQNESCATSSV